MANVEQGEQAVAHRIDTHFSWLRTRLSAERTLMAWLRTAIALIGFGFTLATFFGRFAKSLGLPPGQFPGVWLLSLACIAMGTAASVVALVQYRQVVRYLWTPAFRAVAGMEGHPHATATPWSAVLLGITGLGALLAVGLRL